MSFVAFLKATVLGCAASATLLGTIAVAGASANGDGLVIPIAACWWVIASIVGIAIGRGNTPSPAISRLLAEAPMNYSLPDASPTRVVVNRLWPLFVAVAGAALCVLFAPQIPAMAAGFPVIWALAWRKQEKAVQAIEERDGVRFFVERTSPVKPIRLTRTPWFRAGGHERREPGDPMAPNGSAKR